MTNTQTEQGSNPVTNKSEDVQPEQSLSVPTEASIPENNYSLETKSSPFLLPAPEKAPNCFTNIDDVDATTTNSDINNTILSHEPDTTDIQIESIGVVHYFSNETLSEFKKEKQELKDEKRDLEFDKQEFAIQKRKLREKEKIVDIKLIAKREAEVKEAQALAKVKAEAKRESDVREAEAETNRLEVIQQTHALELTTITDLTDPEQRATKISNLSLEYKAEYAKELVDELIDNNRIYGDFPLIFDDRSRSSLMNLFCANGTFYTQNPLKPVAGEFPIRLEFKEFILTITDTAEAKSYIFTLTYDNIITLKVAEHSSRYFFDHIITNIAHGNIHKNQLNSLIKQLYPDYFYPQGTDLFSIILERRNELELEKATLAVVEDFSDYGVVNEAGKIIVVNLLTKEQLSLAEFKKAYSLKGAKVKVLNHLTGKYNYHHPVDLWETSPNKKVYTGFVCDPSDSSADGLFNTWIKFPITTDDSLIDISLYEEFELNTICNGNEKEYLLHDAFYAQMVQNPEIKLGASIVIFSPKEEIKDTYFRAKQNIFEDYHFKATQKKDLTGANPNLKTAIIVEVDDTLTIGKKAIVDIDTLVRDNMNSFEDKGKTELSIFTARVLINASSYAFASKMKDMGRYFVPRVDTSILNDREKMNALHALIINPKFREAMIHKYQNFDYSPYVEQLTKVAEPILTDDEKMEAFTFVESWLWELIQNDSFSGIHHQVELNGNLRVSKLSLFERYQDDTKDTVTTNASFGREFDAILNSFGALVKNDNNTRIKTKPAKIIKPISEIKAGFITYYKVEASITTDGSWRDDETQEEIAV